MADNGDGVVQGRGNGNVMVRRGRGGRGAEGEVNVGGDDGAR